MRADSEMSSPHKDPTKVSFQLVAFTDNVDAVHVELVTKGVAFVREPVDRAWGMRMGALLGSRGTIWEIAQSLGRESSDGYASRRMTQPQTVDERALLLSYLDAQRNHVLGILEGLSEEALRRPVLPSGWSCLGLVHHLALDVERFWFQGVVTGDQAVIDSLADAGDAWQVGPEVTAGEVFDLYRQEVNRANAIIAATALDAAPAWWPDFFGDFRLYTLREVILHVITETAVHAGHLGAVRELIDGRTWMVLTK